MKAWLDLDQYPLDDPESAAYRALVARCRSDLAAEGMFNLSGFLRPAHAVAAAAGLRDRFARTAFRHARMHNVYFTDPIADLPADHPAQARLRTINRTLCGDQLPDRPLLAIYRWPPLRDFLARVLELRALYLMDDAMARVNVMSYAAGEALNWHFDRSEFTTTLLLQAPEAGGVFEYRSGLRSAADPNFDGVARLLKGDDPQVRRMTLAPGTLNVFRGRNTAHRVTPVRGNRHRIIAVFSYFRTPGVAFSARERIGFYGRAG